MTPAPARLDNDTAREYLRFAGTLADAARNVILSHFRSTSADLSIVDKSSSGQPFDPVTAADRGAEEIMRQMIRATYPNHGILGEEFGDQPPAVGETPPVTWVLDPIDGTKAFIAGIPTWGVLIGINDGSGAVAGIMDQPYTSERFVGGPDGATLNNRPLKTRSCTDLAQATLYCTDRGMFTHSSELAAFDAVSAQVALRRFGADCYAYCMLAHGLIDLVIEGDLKPVDIQALIPIIRGAGGVITNWQGGPPEGGGLVVAAGDAARHQEVLKILASAV